MKNGLKLLLCVDWEGLSLEEENLQALRQFRERWAIPLLHFLNPAYFTSRTLREQASHVEFHEFFTGDDWVGLHLHGARHWVEACGLPFRQGPTFSKAGDQNSREFQGHEVMLHTYSGEEFERMLEKSREIFAEQGWPQPKAFRAGGWMLNPDHLSILREWGFAMDSSRAPAQVLQNTGWQGEPIHKYLEILWGDLDETSQPFFDQGLWHFPNNFGAIDYWQSPPVEWAQSLASPDHPWAVITLHQETAARHLSKLENFLERLQFLNNTKLMSSFLESSCS